METLLTSSFIKDYPASVVIVNSEMQIIDHSKLWLKELENLNGSPIGLPIYDVINYTSKEFSKRCEECLVGGEQVKFIQELNQPKLNTKWLEWTISPWTENPEKINGLIIVKDDITETKKREELLLKSKSIARIGGWEVDLLANTVYWTQVTKEIHEVPENYVPNLEEGINFYKEGTDRDKISILVSDAINKGLPWDTELRIITAKGKELWVRAKGEVEIVDDKCVRIYGTFQDIDEKKRIELKYNEVADRLAMATKAAQIGIWEYNVVDNILVWDDNMYELYGLNKKNFSGVVEAWEASVHPDDIAPSQELLQRALNGEAEFDPEFRVLWPNGEIRHIKAIAFTHRDNNGNALKMIGTNWDITKNKNAEKKLKNLLEITSEQNNSLMNFAHIVSHNLRSHSSNLSMLTGFLDQEGDNNEKERLIKMLCEASESLDETVQNLTEVVQVKIDTLDKMRPVNLYETIIGVEKNLAVLLKEKNTVCEIEVGKKLQINAIPAYMDSILLNLFTNSIKYSSPKRSLALKITAEQKDDHTLVTFSDNGQGIDLKRHGNAIFGMYKTFHKHKDAKGIGLFITKNQIESMNGKIEVDSQVNKGTNFRLFFEAINV
ncbi:MAG: PAS domain-containing protein [Eudoraea sp.]|uniref:PAS domain-containing protein n=1 Tax=Eudoraea sp. TaxID=1979955 RepID=UPI00326763CD